MQPKPDRISAVLEGGNFRFWHKKCLEGLVDAKGVSLDRLLVKEPPEGSFWSPRSLTEYFHDLCSRHSPSRKIPEEPVGSLFENVQKGTSRRSSGSNAPRTLWLDFTRHAPHRELLGGTQDLLWWFPVLSSPFPPGVREIMDDLDGLPLTLFEASPNSSASLLRKARLRNIKYSYRKQKENLLKHTLKWPAETYKNYEAYKRVDQSTEFSPDSGQSNSGSLLQLIQFGLTLGREKVRHGTRKFLKRDKWNIGLVEQKIEEAVEEKTRNAPIQWARSDRKDIYRADPFGVSKGSDEVIFFERYDLKNSNGDICFSKNLFDEEGIKEFEVLPDQIHQSYPYVLRHDGTYYMVLEEADETDLNLYEARNFPESWIRVCTIVEDFPALDPTIFRHGRKWWLTASSRKDSGNYALYLWYSDQLEGPWVPHDLQPVKQDVRSSRPAGTPFRIEDELYRPSQNCSRRYGREVVLNRIDEVSPSTYRETPVRTLSPETDGPYPDGIHTISAFGNRILLDGKREEVTLKPLLSYLGSLLSG